MPVREQLWREQSSGLGSTEFGGALGIRKGCSLEVGQWEAEKEKKAKESGLNPTAKIEQQIYNKKEKNRY